MYSGDEFSASMLFYAVIFWSFSQTPHELSPSIPGATTYVRVVIFMLVGFHLKRIEPVRQLPISFCPKPDKPEKEIQGRKSYDPQFHPLPKVDGFMALGSLFHFSPRKHKEDQIYRPDCDGRKKAEYFWYAAIFDENGKLQGFSLEVFVVYHPGQK